jgi:hypothetical protein
MTLFYDGESTRENEIIQDMKMTHYLGVITNITIKLAKQALLSGSTMGLKSPIGMMGLNGRRSTCH